MIRSLSAFSTALAMSTIGAYCAGASAASPPGGDGQCSFVLEGPVVVNVSGVDYVRAAVHPGSCTLHVHAEDTVCLSVDGDDSPGQCEWDFEPRTPEVYYPYRRGATYIVKGQQCLGTLEGSASPATPTTVCQNIGPSRAAL